jgi:HSP20 family protein
MFLSPSAIHRTLSYGGAPSIFINRRDIGTVAEYSAMHANKPVRVETDETSVTLSLDVPGLSKAQLTIAIEDDVVRIESKADAPRSFKAAYRIATNIDATTSQAKLEDGVLTLKLSKTVPVNRETLITIN